MKKARHNLFIYNFLKIYTLWKVKRCFDRVVFAGEAAIEDKSVFVISNHVGWWDGFWVMYLNIKKFGKKFYFMMLNSQLEKHWGFRYAGGYPVKKKSRDLIDCLHYTSELLTNSDNMVLMFPQGTLESVYRQDIVFEKGVERILDNKRGETGIVFVANLVDYFKNPRPSLFIYYMSYKGGATDRKRIEEAYNGFYQNALKQQIKLNRG